MNFKFHIIKTTVFILILLSYFYSSDPSEASKQIVTDKTIIDKNSTLFLWALPFRGKYSIKYLNI